MSRAASIAALVLFVAPLRAGDPPGEAPVASFALTDGWVDFQVTRAGAPVADARVTVLTGAEVWARGETGATGRGTFPKPNRPDCQVVFDFGAGPSAPVPLAFPSDGTVVPNRSPVLDGTAECCQPARRATAPPPAPASRGGRVPYRYLIPGLVIAGAVLWIVTVRWRARRP